MKVELKRLKVYPRLSQETTAFNADLWIDDVMVGTAENSGTGGDNLLRFNDRETREAFHKFCESQPPDVTEYGTLSMNADLYIALLVESTMEKTWLAKQSKTKVLFTLPDSKRGDYQAIPFQPGGRAKTEAYIR